MYVRHLDGVRRSGYAGRESGALQTVILLLLCFARTANPLLNLPVSSGGVAAGLLHAMQLKGGRGSSRMSQPREQPEPERRQSGGRRWRMDPCTRNVTQPAWPANHTRTRVRRGQDGKRGLVLSQSIWSHQSGEIGIVSAAKSTDLYRKPRMAPVRTARLPELTARSSRTFSS